ncbi:MAG: hypothetical protein JNJ46_32410 [Myxococcales bacterium]|nr:hypothetical protein [Myxococcales bacterium]
MSDDGVQHPIDPFLTVWAAAGGADGFDLRARVYQALGIAGTWDRERLRLTLRSLLVLQPEELERFERTFATFFPEEQLPDWLQRRLAGEAVAGVAWNLEHALADLRRAPHDDDLLQTAPMAWSPRKSQPWRVAAAGITFLALLGFLMWLSNHSVDLSVPWKPPSAPPALAVADGGSGPDGGAAIGEGTKATEGPIPKIAFPNDRPLWLQWTALAALVLGLLAAFVILGWRHERRRWLRSQAAQEADLPQPVVWNAEAETGQELDLRSLQAAVPLSPHELDVLGYQTGLVLTSDTPLLDVPETVNATVRCGGVLDPRYRPARRPGRLQVVTLQRLDLVSRVLIDCLVQGIRRRGVDVLFDPEGSAATCQDEEADLILIFIHTAELTQEGHRELAAWLQRPHVAVVEARDPGLWGAELAGLPVGVFAPDGVGLQAALAAARSGLRPSPLIVRRKESGLSLLADALPLAVACALAQPCDLATADQLRRRFTPRLPFSRLQRILQLDGVVADPAGWRFRQDLTEWLTRRAGPDFRSAVLAWQEQRLWHIPAPPASRAALARERELALVRLQRALAKEHTPDEPAVRTALHVLLSQADREALARRVHERSSAVGRLIRMPADIAQRVQPQLRRLRMLVETATASPTGALPPPAFGDLHLHRSLIIGTLQLLFAIFFRPIAWRRHLQRIDPTLDPLLYLAKLTLPQLRNPQIRRLLLQFYVVVPLVCSMPFVVMFEAAWMFGFEPMRFTGATISAFLMFSFNGLWGGQPAALLGLIALGGTLLFFGDSYISLQLFFDWHLINSIGPLERFLLLTIGSLSVWQICSLYNHSKPPAPPVPISRYAVAVVVASGLGCLSGTVGFLLEGYFGASSSRGSGSWWMPPSDIFVYVFGFLLIFNAIVCGAIVLVLQQVSRRTYMYFILIFGIIATMVSPLTFFEQISNKFLLGLFDGFATSNAVAIALTLPVWVFARVGRVSAPGRIVPLVLLFAALAGDVSQEKVLWLPGTVLGLLLGWGQRFLRPLVVHRLLTLWNGALERADRQRARSPSLLRWHSAFWDEGNEAPLRGLDRYLRLVRQRSPVEARAAAAYLSTTPQRWAVSADVDEASNEPTVAFPADDTLLLLGREPQWHRLQQALSQGRSSALAQLVLIPAPVGQGDAQFLAGVTLRLRSDPRFFFKSVPGPWQDVSDDTAATEGRPSAPIVDALAQAFACSAEQLRATLRDRLSTQDVIILHDAVDANASDAMYRYYVMWLPALLRDLQSLGGRGRLIFLQPVRWTDTPRLARWDERTATWLARRSTAKQVPARGPVTSQQEPARQFKVRMRLALQRRRVDVCVLPELKPLTVRDLFAASRLLQLRGGRRLWFVLKTRWQSRSTDDFLRHIADAYARTTRHNARTSPESLPQGPPDHNPMQGNAT